MSISLPLGTSDYLLYSCQSFYLPNSLYAHSNHNTIKMTLETSTRPPPAYPMHEIPLASTTPNENTLHPQNSQAESWKWKQGKVEWCPALTGLFLIPVGVMLIFLATCLRNSDSLRSGLDRRESWPWFKIIMLGIIGSAFIVVGLCLVFKVGVTDWCCERRRHRGIGGLPV